jgi:hypothetical protein
MAIEVSAIGAAASLVRGKTMVPHVPPETTNVSLMATINLLSEFARIDHSSFCRFTTKLALKIP